MAVNAVQSPSAAQTQDTQSATQVPRASSTQQTQKVSALPQDTVTLSAAAKQQSAGAQQTNGVPQKTPQTGDVDHDGDNK